MVAHQKRIPLATCRSCIQQISSERATVLSCGHLFHVSCANEFLQHDNYICSFCNTTISEFQEIKMRRHRKLSPPLSYLSPIPEDSELILSKLVLHDFEEICHSKLSHSFSPNSIHRKSPNSIIKYCIKLFHLCRDQLNKRPEFSLHYSLQILWLLKNIRKTSPDVVRVSTHCNDLALILLEQARDAYVNAHSC